VGPLPIAGCELILFGVSEAECAWKISTRLGSITALDLALDMAETGRHR
jgi:hypothetical protein